MVVELVLEWQSLLGLGSAVGLREIHKIFVEHEDLVYEILINTAKYYVAALAFLSDRLVCPTGVKGYHALLTAPEIVALYQMVFPSFSSVERVKSFNFKSFVATLIIKVSTGSSKRVNEVFVHYHASHRESLLIHGR